MQLSAEHLPSCLLSRKLECRANSFLSENGAGDVKIIVKVYSSASETKVRAQYKRMYNTADSFPYCAKSIYVFSKVEDEEVCIFGMHTQEYGNNCPAPNKGTVYVSLLDSVQFFQPWKLRGKVYKQIIMGYLKHVAELGYRQACLWSCVPGEENSEYIFHRRPSAQNALSQENLNQWYKGIMDKCVDEEIVESFDLRYSLPDKETITDIPYYDGDIFVIKMERFIQEIQRERLRGNFTDLIKNKIANSRVSGQFWIDLGKGTNTIRDSDRPIECEVAKKPSHVYKFFKSLRPQPYQFTDLRQAAYATKALVFKMRQDSLSNTEN